MIITRTPLRISIGGGGTDLPSYYRKFGGFVISAAIDKYVYISINRTMFPGYFLKYSEIEKTESYNDIRHPLFREALQIHDVQAPVEITSLADIPAGTGLGSSGSFLVGLLHAIYAYKRHSVNAEQLAREACDIEINRLKEPVGKQDQYIAAYGGISCQEYRGDDTVAITPLRVSGQTMRDLQESLMLFFVGYTRRASLLLDEQNKKSIAEDKAMLENLHFVKKLGLEIKAALEAGNVGRFGEMMHEHWTHKRARSAGMSNNRIDELYALARKKGGATGGKLVGAGGSGFLLFQATDRQKLRNVMLEAGLQELDFRFDFDGSVVLMRGH